MWNRLRKYLSNEIVIEYKACLYFFCLLVFYCVYLLWRTVYSASILYMVEMVLTSYIMGYLQNYVFHNFDEAERLGKKEVFGILCCTCIYTAVSFGFRWFERNLRVTAMFFVFVFFSYVCIYLNNKIKRMIDTERLNGMLTEYKRREQDE